MSHCLGDHQDGLVVVARHKVATHFTVSGTLQQNNFLPVLMCSE